MEYNNVMDSMTMNFNVTKFGLIMRLTLYVSIVYYTDLQVCVSIAIWKYGVGMFHISIWLNHGILHNSLSFTNDD